MAKNNPVLVYNKKTLSVEYINDEKIPEFLNGESGFHVYHVRMLTEFILQELRSTEGYSYLTDEIITSMAMASSLHDIGKERVPKSILDSKDRLSPVEYDIVKKHSILGYEIISEIESEIDEETIKYAKEIARSHHERYDGTGYPDGLKGEEIPISAQAVSIADVFDALTSERSYKKAISKDVAIEMIANGMCGVFQPDLIECLTRVVNHNDLIKIREQFYKKRKVVAEQNYSELKRVLLVGNTGYLNDEFISNTFDRARVTVVGNSDIRNSSNVKKYTVKEPSYTRLFETYDYDLVIYFAGELTYSKEISSDSEKLREILEALSKTKKEAKFLYLSSLDGAFNEKSEKGILTNAKEQLCMYFKNKHSLDLKIIRIPYLFSGTNKYDFLHKIFRQMTDNNKITVDEMPSARSYFLSMRDLSELVVRYVDNWTIGDGVLTVNDEFNITFSDILSRISELKSDVTVDFVGTNSGYDLDRNNKALRSEYGWFSKVSIIADIEEQYDNYLISINQKATNWLDKVRIWFEKKTLIVKTVELFSLFILTELLILITGSSIHFSIVDFRMAFIVIIATIHGLSLGMAAAGLSSVSWLVSKVVSGTNLLTIFYEPTNWLAFVFYFLVGAICGYVRIKNSDEISNIKTQNRLLEEKLIFSRDLYEETYSEKRILKKQIIASKDSFGKIFDITRQLDTVEPRELYLKIMNTFEDVLENKSISVYSVSENAAFGRLEVASRDIMNIASRSIALDSYAEIIERVTQNEVWKNTELSSGKPMYASGVLRKGKLELLIFIWQTEQDQRSLYYINLFKILCDLVQISLLRAYDYNQAIYKEQYIENTRILNTKAFESINDSFKKMAERKVFSYVQLEIDCLGHSLEEVDKMLSGRIRTNDIVGLKSDNKIVVLLSQATKNDLSFILPRFKDLDIDITII